MKLSKEKIIELIREELNEMAGDDWDPGDHVWHKRQGRERRGEPDPRSRPVGDGSEGTYVDTPGTEEAIIDSLKQQFGPAGEKAARAIVDAVKKMKEDGLI